MLVKIISHAGRDITNALLIEGRTWNRTTDLLKYLGTGYDWQEGEHFHVLTLAKPDIPDMLGTTLNDIWVSENFKLSEFQCKGSSCCGNAVKLHPDLVRRLQAMRTELGMEIWVSSGYRCLVHNQRERGDPNSTHMRGIAADIRANDMPRLTGLAEKYFADGGLGTSYANHIHVDVRGSRSRW